MISRPNILWVFFEDTNPFYGCYGDPIAKTPVLDKLASEGCLWNRCFSTAGVCAPSRSAIITGMYAISIGTMHHRTTHQNKATPELPTPYSAVIPHFAKCLPEYLRAKGYYCTNNAKTDYQFDPPFTAWDELGLNAHWRGRPDKDQPFFAVYNLNRTHESGMWEGLDIKITVDPNEIPLPPYFPDTPKVRDSMARMYSNIEHHDALFGKILKRLEDDGLADNTIVFHSSDHGPMPRGKRWPYDSGLHVPLIVRWPAGLDAGSKNENLVSTIDLGPTVLSLAGIEVPGHMQGQAFLGSQSKPNRKHIYASRDRHDESYDMVRAVRDKRFKYMRNFRPDLPFSPWVPYQNRHPIMQELWRLEGEEKLTGPQKLIFQNSRSVEELYDTQADPYEINNLAGKPEHQETLEQLRVLLEEWRNDVGDMGEIDEAEMVHRWYPNGKRPTTAKPIFVPIGPESYGQKPSLEGGDFQGPLLLQLHCATQGASIGYRLDGDKESNWRLYMGPIRLASGQTGISAKAIRIGYLESDEAKGIFKVTPQNSEN